MNIRYLCAALLLALSAAAWSQPGAAPDNEEEYLAWAKGVWESLDRQTGDIKLADAVATLHVPDNFYYLNPEDSAKVLTDIWGNPPGEPVLGMLFPADSTPFDRDSWAVTVEYEDSGYVSDEDANEIDYSELLTQMKADARTASAARQKQGYEPFTLVGWAEPPRYEEASHKLHWAKEIQFGDQAAHTLNYNIRVLGRKGVLVMNFIADMAQKPLIDSQLDSVLDMAEFDQGHTYADFNPDIDKVAAYGLGALVAGKVMAKTGLLAAALLFLKKFGIVIVAGIGAFFRKIFGRKEPQ
ncbi:DUF2167 domain-containing protein [Microbulbifer sp. SAOS-129_SWC]|uniref:DUF2167 domain-containing protein n=1 Tax=Microbulbifer sp. SAOS-129_SWC TaxID=3145235 RepID=UPI0032179343